jgi:predicted RNase H-like nuclease (RuvC/YqgF family)
MKNNKQEYYIMNSKQFAVITTGAIVASGVIGKLIGDKKTYKEKMYYYKETSNKLFHSLGIKKGEIVRLKQANRDQTEVIKDLTAKNEELKQTYEIQTRTIEGLVEENKKLKKKLKVSNSVRGKLLNKLSSLHRLVKNLEPTGDLMKQYQEFILTPKREHDAIKDEETVKEGV